ncbi:MAG: DNA repair protein RecN [Clostridia bacterium]|nr:DNA repair protein RecN [Clostridia bacterium]
MLLSLHIENIAVIKSVDFSFSRGFMVLTGETGAGKSVIIDSINLLLGAKAERELIRSGEHIATVSGLFGNFSDTVNAKLSDLGVLPDEEGCVFVQRILTDDGKSKINLNGRSISLSLLKSVTPLLVTIHGQSDTAALIDTKNHIEIVDTYASIQTQRAEYEQSFARLCEIRARIKDVSEKAREGERLKEILEYQIKDIDAVSPHEGEEEELVEKKVKIKNSEKIIKNSEFVFKALKGSEKGGVSYLIDRSITALSQISDVVVSYQEYAERLRDILYQVDDIAEEVYAVIDDAADNPEKALNEIESRLDKISRLKRKYGLTVSAVLEFRQRAAEELSEIENSDALIKSLEQKEEVAYREALELADRLHEGRCAVIKELEAKVKETLEFLDMPKVVFFVSLKEQAFGERKELSRDGYDSVEFYISANRGAEAQPISKIASGGELSRIMLALKSVIADKDGVPTVIYDEIDAGVSGKTARKIGIKMHELSSVSQLFCVTHSAQIASLGDTHFLISKSDVNGATETSVRELDYDGRVAEISRILGGIDVTDAQRAAAVDMLSERG